MNPPLTRCAFCANCVAHGPISATMPLWPRWSDRMSTGPRLDPPLPACNRVTFLEQFSIILQASFRDYFFLSVFVRSWSQLGPTWVQLGSTIHPKSSQEGSKYQANWHHDFDAIFDRFWKPTGSNLGGFGSSS